MKAEQRADFVESLLSSWIDAGLSLEEMEKTATTVADAIEHFEQQGHRPSGVFASMEKQGFLTGMLSTIGNKALDAVSNTGSKLVSNVSQAGLAAAPWIAGLGLAIPAAVGYVGGQVYGGASEDPDETYSQIKQQELIDTLREHAAIARARNRDRQSLGSNR